MTITERVVNADLVRRVMAQIKADPESWHQGGWANECGTVHCFAGWAWVLATGLPLKRSMFTCGRINGLNFFIEAQRLLGLTYSQAHRIFYFMGVEEEVGEEIVERHPTYTEFAEIVEEVTGVSLADLDDVPAIPDTVAELLGDKELSRDCKELSRDCKELVDA